MEIGKWKYMSYRVVSSEFEQIRVDFSCNRPKAAVKYPMPTSSSGWSNVYLKLRKLIGERFENIKMLIRAK